MTESEAIDRAVFDQLLTSIGDDREFLAELIATYFDDTPKRLDALRAALATNHAEEFRRAAHSLKSTSANFGARVFSGMCKELEDIGKTGSLDGAGAKIAAVEEEYARVRAALASAARL